ncbi:MAG: DUF4382 domain-containing protein [Fodinibius sp.]|nr:DUF4382 domain-containing protein [Fodinibius sp.]
MGFTACDSTSSNGGTGTMDVTMTDAPANYDSVHVTINEVRVRHEEDENDDSEGEDADNESKEDGWVTISDQQMRVNLLELTNGSQVSLGSQELESGTYSQIRLILGDDNTVTVDGETHNLQTPSAQQSGLKLNIDADVEEDTQYSLLIDFDAARSIVQQGNGSYLLKPVLRAVNLAETGAITGNIQPTDFKTNVLAVTDDDTVTSTITADNGDFKIIGLTEGTYDVVFDPSSDQYSDSTQTGIDVTANEDTDLGTIELESNSAL